MKCSDPKIIIKKSENKDRAQLCASCAEPCPICQGLSPGESGTP